MLNVLVVSASYKPAYVYGGPTVSVGNLCEQLVKIGANVTVLTTTANGKEDFNYSTNEDIYNTGVKVRYFKRITGDHSHFSPALLVHLWRNVKKYDVVHIQAWWNLVSVGGAFICVLRCRRYILSPRGTLSGYSFNNRKNIVKKLFHSLIGKPLLKKASFLVSSKKEQADIVNLGLATKKNLIIVPNICEFPNVSNIQRSAPGDKLRIIFLSRIEPKKGLEFLIDALDLVDFPVVLDIYGGGNEAYVRHVKQRASTNRNAESIFFHGPVYGDEKFKVLALHDVFVLPSYDENFANVVLECLIVGTLVMLTEEVGLADVVIANSGGLLIRRDAKNIAKVLESVLQKMRNRDLNCDIGTDWVTKLFDPCELAKRHLEYYAFAKNGKE